eukprot:scaffold11373_cov51-Phaeocystis_antarctica.AAC.1
MYPPPSRAAERTPDSCRGSTGCGRPKRLMERPWRWTRGEGPQQRQATARPSPNHLPATRPPSLNR